MHASSSLLLHERATSLQAFSRRHLLKPCQRGLPSANSIPRPTCYRRTRRALCKAASSPSSSAELKFVTQGRNLKLTDALHDFAVRIDSFACSNTGVMHLHVDHECNVAFDYGSVLPWTASPSWISILIESQLFLASAAATLMLSHILPILAYMYLLMSLLTKGGLLL